jgi:hypothetical protein
MGRSPRIKMSTQLWSHKLRFNVKAFFLALMFTVLPINVTATVGYYGNDLKVISMNAGSFIVEQAGHQMKVDSNRLPPDLVKKWKSSIGKTFESTIPLNAILSDEAIPGAKPLKVTDR